MKITELWSSFIARFFRRKKTAKTSNYKQNNPSHQTKSTDLNTATDSTPQEINQTSLIANLPDELKLKIIADFLDIRTLGSVASTNKEFNNLAKDNSIWKIKFQKHFPQVYLNLSDKGNIQNWLHQYHETENKVYANLGPIKKLIRAAKENDFNKFKLIFASLEKTVGGKKYLECLDDFEKHDAFGISLLMWLRKNNKQEWLDFIYQETVGYYSKQDSTGNSIIDINKINAQEKNILHWAVLCHQPLDTINKLIAAKVNIAAMTIDASTVLHLAIRADDHEMIKHIIASSDLADLKNMFCQRTKNFNETPLLFAFRQQNFAIIKELLKSDIIGFNEKVMTNFDLLQKYHIAINDTPLTIAIKMGQLEIVKMIVEHKNAPNLDENNAYYLHLAAKAGHADIVEYLIKKGIDKNARDNHDVTPLFLAVEHGHETVVKLLLQKGADVNVTLTRNNYQSKLKLERGDNLLHVACRSGQKVIVDLLIAHHQSLANYKNSRDKKPLDVATQEIQAYTQLQQKLADTNARLCEYDQQIKNASAKKRQPFKFFGFQFFKSSPKENYQKELKKYEILKTLKNCVHGANKLALAKYEIDIIKDKQLQSLRRGLKI